MKPESIVALLVGLVVTVAGWLVFMPRQHTEPAPGPVIIQPDGRQPIAPVIMPTPAPWWAPYWPWYRPVVPAPVPVPRPYPVPTPCPGPAPRPPAPPGPHPHPRDIEASVGGTTAPDGTPIQLDLPNELHRHNITSQGQGCCVFRSLHHSATYQNIPALIDFAEWVRDHHLPGGGYSGNVKARITAICRERGLPEPEYIQIENSRDLSILEAACKSGRMPACTYSRSPTGRYNGQRIAHMVNMVHCDGKYVAILDNNYVDGPQHIEWDSPDDYLRISNPGGYWAVILLTSPGPPPPPKN